MSGERIARGLRWAVVVAVIGLAATLAGAFLVSARAFFAGWLAAYVYWISLPLTALALLMIHDLIGGDWGVVLRPLLEAAAATLPLFVLVLLPIPLAGLAALYPWARPDEAATLPNTFYLNGAGFDGRAAAYYVVWLALVVLTLRRSRLGLLARDRAGSWVSAVGLIALGLTVSFAGIDGVMSLEPRWSSTMFGMIFGSSEFITAFAVLVLAAVTVGLPAVERDKARAVLGTILLVALLFWSYVEFVQFLGVWEENLTSEIPWYLHRFTGGWRAVAIAVALGRFALPFLVLIWAPLRRQSVVLGALCAWLVAIDLLYAWWLVLPAGGGGWEWPAVAAAVGIGGLWALAFLAWLKAGGTVADRWLATPKRLGHA